VKRSKNVNYFKIFSYYISMSIDSYDEEVNDMMSHSDPVMHHHMKIGMITRDIQDMEEELFSEIFALERQGKTKKQIEALTKSSQKALKEKVKKKLQLEADFKKKYVVGHYGPHNIPILARPKTPEKKASPKKAAPKKAATKKAAPKKAPAKKAATKTKRSRCPNGTRKNPKTGNCEKKK
tara:strand:+ start:172 stop:711 length:540 start_codon:yes stop_codon:yes gene_type:complete